MKRYFKVVLISFALMLLPSCGVLKDWTRTTFKQGQNYKSQKKIIASYLRSVNIYDQFSTVALFDVLWLSDEIRTLYADKYITMHGRSDEVRKTFLRRQLKMNDRHISFYVLSTHEVPLHLVPSDWILYLEVDGKKYTPETVNAVELSSEYQSFFGKVLTSHKTPYQVTFSAKNLEGQYILDKAKIMKLHFNGPNHYTYVSWHL